MKEPFTFLTAGIPVITQTRTTALGILLLILALMGVVAFPKPTFGLIASFGLLVLTLRRPAVCAAALGAIGVAVAFLGRVGRQVTSQPLLLTHHRACPLAQKGDPDPRE